MEQRRRSDDIILASGQFFKEKDYWLDKLKGELVKTGFPSDYKKRTGTGNSSANKQQIDTTRFRFDETLCTGLIRLSNKSDSRLYMILTSALVVLLAKYSGSKDIIVGAPIDKQELEGEFVNTLLALRNQIEKNKTFKEFLLQVRRTIVEANENQNYPIETLLYQLNIPFREMEDFPLFDTAILLENIHDKNYLRRFTLNMIFSFCRTDASIEGELEYNSLMYKKTTIERITGYFKNLLQVVLTHLDLAIEDIDILSEEEKKQILYDFNHKTLQYPKDKTLWQLFEEQVERTPDYIALHGCTITWLRGQDAAITYKELNNRANRLAGWLRREGVKPDEIAALMIERSTDTLIAIFAVLKAGGAYLPINPDIPDARKLFMLKDSNARILLSREYLLEKNKGEFQKVTAGNIFLMDDERVYSKDTTNPGNINSAGDLAYVIYTSGSTGKPKGTMVEHKNVHNLAAGLKEKVYRKYSSNPLRFSLVAPFEFDASVQQIFGALLQGHSLHIVPEDTRIDGGRLLEFFKTHRINISDGTPTHIRMMLESMGEKTFELNMNHFTIAGEELPQKITEEFLNHFTGKIPSISNLYGPTETCVDSTIYDISTEELNSLDTIPIGEPLPNQQVYIVDKKNKIQPIGITGELYIGGDGIARGYLNNPELTNSRFPKQIFGWDTGRRRQRLYKTGDLARWLPDGNVEFSGRMDFQIKIRGFRIELEEIESKLMEIEPIKNAVVTVREDEDGNGNKAICAYYVEKNEKQAELWPSVGEYFVWDDLLHHSMTHDEPRNKRYKAAINRLVKDKTVVEIGTGPNAILAQFCIEAGARKVYAIEILEESYNKAKETVKQLGLEEKIILIHGDAASVQLPEKVDVCLSQIIGNIASSEGVIHILNNARRFLKEDGVMIPEKCDTKIAAAYLPQMLHDNPGFSEISKVYPDRIFERFGYKFDFRLCIKNFPKSHIISNAGTFESLDFSKINVGESSREIHLKINRKARLDGLLLWIRLFTIEGQVIDTLENEYIWSPVYVPVFYPGIEVFEGDVIKAECIRTFSKNNITPDYAVKGTLIPKNGKRIEFNYELPYLEKSYRKNVFYQKIFEDDSIREIKGNISYKKLTVSELRDYLSKNLPSYMIPTYFIRMEEIPLTHSGKFDRKALPKPQLTIEQDYAAPKNELEEKLAYIWQEVLGVKRIGINDNFFVIGGDSIRAIQITARLHNCGLRVDVRDLFINPTIKKLAASVKSVDRVAAAEQGVVEGEVQLTATQQWFFQEDFTNRHHFNHAIMLYNEEGFEKSKVKKVFKKITEHHDALRMVYKIEGNRIVQINRGHSEKEEMFELEIVNLENKENQDAAVEIERVSNQAQREIDLTKGPLVKLRLFETKQGDHLLIVIHHLVIDGVSWRILLEDLVAGYRQLQQGGEIKFPNKTHSFKYWAERLNKYAESKAAVDESDYWKKIENTKIGSLPKDYEVGKEYKKHRYFETIAVSMDKTETELLLTKVHHAYNTEINDILLAALGLAVNQWTGLEKVLVNLEGHGREPIIKDVDISRTVGWFTSQYPVVLDFSTLSPKDKEDVEAGDLSYWIKEVKETLRRIPNKGIGYSILKYLTPKEKNDHLNSLLRPEIIFNYLGQFDQENSDSDNLIKISPMSKNKGNCISPDLERTMAIDISGIIVERRLSLSASYNKYEYRDTTIQKLVDYFSSNLVKIINHCIRQEKKVLTPSDFTMKDMGIKELETVLEMVRDI